MSLFLLIDLWIIIPHFNYLCPYFLLFLLLKLSSNTTKFFNFFVIFLSCCPVSQWYYTFLPFKTFQSNTNPFWHCFSCFAQFSHFIFSWIGQFAVCCMEWAFSPAGKMLVTRSNSILAHLCLIPVFWLPITQTLGDNGVGTINKSPSPMWETWSEILALAST